MTECIPLSKADEIISALKKYSPKNIERDEDHLEIDFINSSGEELSVYVSYEFGIFFGEWDAPYLAYEEEFDIFMSDMIGILENRKFTVIIYEDDEWRGSWLSDDDTFDEKDIRKRYGNDITIKCVYWDNSKNKIC